MIYSSWYVPCPSFVWVWRSGAAASCCPACLYVSHEDSNWRDKTERDMAEEAKDSSEGCSGHILVKLE